MARVCNRTPEQIRSLHQICREQLLTEHNVVLLCGAGVTMSEYGGAASWSALLNDGVQFASEKGADAGAIGAMKAILAKPGATPEEWLLVGHQLTQILKSLKLWELWLRYAVDDRFTKAEGKLLHALGKTGQLPRVRFATTNYDFLLERAMGWVHGQAGLPGFCWQDKSKAVEWQCGKLREVYHLHGHVRAKDSIVLGTASYDALNADRWIDQLRNAMAVTDTVIFVGCGATLQDPAFQKILNTGYQQMQEVSGNRRWFQLVSNEECVGNPWINALPYGADYTALPDFIQNSLLPWLAAVGAGAVATTLVSVASGATIAASAAATIQADDAERIYGTRSAILKCLKQAHFSAIPTLVFAGDGLPEVVSQAFPQAGAALPRLTVADQCMKAISVFASKVVAEADGLPPLSRKQKADWRFHLINAMQQAILLSARQEKLQAARAAALDGSSSCQLEVGFWESVSIILRKELAAHLKIKFPDGLPPEFRDEHHLRLADQVELGTGEKLAGMEGVDRQRAQVEARKVVWRALYPLAAEFPGSDNDIDVLQSELANLKDNGQQLLAIFEPRHGQLSPTLLQWLGSDMSIGVVAISTRQGVFELTEGTWRARLSALYKTLLPFES